jgi:Tfp pilus assembly protein FimT
MTMTLPTGNDRAGETAARSHGAAWGFTLVELTIVVFILATMLAVAVPSFLRSYNSSQLNAAARAVVTMSQLARLQAAVHQRETTFHIDLDHDILQLTQTIRREAEDEDEDEGERELEVTHKIVELPHQVQLVAAERTGDPAQREGEVAIVFHVNGTCDGGTLWLQGMEKRDALAIVFDPVTARATPLEVKP